MSENENASTSLRRKRADRSGEIRIHRSLAFVRSKVSKTHPGRIFEFGTLSCEHDGIVVHELIATSSATRSAWVKALAEYVNPDILGETSPPHFSTLDSNNRKRHHRTFSEDLLRPRERVFVAARIHA